jgi:hypothetical protein
MPTSVLSRRFHSSEFDSETLKTIIIFCGLGLAVSLLCARHGLDLSGGLI